MCHLILKDKDVTVEAARGGCSFPPPQNEDLPPVLGEEVEEEVVVVLSVCSARPALKVAQVGSLPQILWRHENRLWKLKTLPADQLLLLVFTDK